MKKPNTAPISPLQCRVLSALEMQGELSSHNLVLFTSVTRNVLYVLASRLAQEQYVRRRETVLPGHNGKQTLYSITARGKKARATFAADCGLRA